MQRPIFRSSAKPAKRARSSSMPFWNASPSLMPRSPSCVRPRQPWDQSSLTPSSICNRFMGIARRCWLASIRKLGKDQAVWFMVGGGKVVMEDWKKQNYKGPVVKTAHDKISFQAWDHGIYGIIPGYGLRQALSLDTIWMSLLWPRLFRGRRVHEECHESPQTTSCVIPVCSF